MDKLEKNTRGMWFAILFWIILGQSLVKYTLEACGLASKEHIAYIYLSICVILGILMVIHALFLHPTMKNMRLQFYVLHRIVTGLSGILDILC